MPDQIFTVRAEFTLRVPDGQSARNRVALYTAGMPGLIATRMTEVVEGSERTWDDDIANVDLTQPITEEELFNGHGVDHGVRERRVPHALKRDATGRRFP